MTVKTTAACAIAALVASLAGCNQNGAATSQMLSLSSPKYCTPFRTAQAGASTAAAADPSVGFEDCVHRWGYVLAPARDPADVVAQAVVDACAADLSRWNQQDLGNTPQGAPNQGAPQGTPDMATSLTTGQPTNMMSEHARYAQSRALFYVVQARAGNCAAPPPNEGAQTGTPVG